MRCRSRIWLGLRLIQSGDPHLVTSHPVIRFPTGIDYDACTFIGTDCNMERIWPNWAKVRFLHEIPKREEEVIIRVDYITIAAQYPCFAKEKKWLTTNFTYLTQRMGKVAITSDSVLIDNRHVGGGTFEKTETLEGRASAALKQKRNDTRVVSTTALRWRHLWPVAGHSRPS